MPYDRRTTTVLLAMMGLVGVAASAGCMRPSILRASSDNLPELTPAGGLHPVTGEPTPAPAGPTAPTQTTSWARDTGTPATRKPAGSGPAPGNPTPTGPAPGDTDPSDPATPSARPSDSPAAGPEPTAAPPSTSTPLLDAEIRRAQAITRQQIESLRAADTPTPIADPITPPADPSGSKRATASGPSSARPGPDEAPPDILAPLPLAATSPADNNPAEAEDAPAAGGIAIPPLIPIDPNAAGSTPLATLAPLPNLAADIPTPTPAPAQPVAAEEGRKDDPRPDQPGTKPAESPDSTERDGRPPLQITAIRLCSRVIGFGDVVPLNPDAIRPGRSALVYWEMTGLEYQPRGDAQVSRAVAHLELRSGADGPIAWEQPLGTAEDRCPRPRHDYFARCQIQWPASLEPGDYRLRIIQTDLIGNRTTSSEVPVTIVR